MTLETGEKLYRATEMQQVDGKLKPVPVGWKSAGVRQRVHHVEERDGEVFVTFGTEPKEELPSDRYALRDKDSGCH